MGFLISGSISIIIHPALLSINIFKSSREYNVQLAMIIDPFSMQFYLIEGWIIRDKEATDWNYQSRKRRSMIWDHPAEILFLISVTSVIFQVHFSSGQWISARKDRTLASLLKAILLEIPQSVSLRWASLNISNRTPFIFEIKSKDHVTKFSLVEEK